MNHSLIFFKNLDMGFERTTLFLQFSVEIFFRGSAYFCGSGTRKPKCFVSQALVLSRIEMYES